MAVYAHLTPNDEGGDYLCRRLRFRSELAPHVSYVLTTLTDPSAWEAFGDMSPEDASALAWEMWNEYATGGDTCMIGTIVEYITDGPPNGVLPLDGSTYDAVDYPELFSVLDPVYKAGDTFTLPDTRGRVMVGAGAGVGLSNRAVGDSLGLEQVTLAISQLPPHDHAYNENITADLDLESPGAPIPAPAPAVPSVTGSQGGGEAHENMQPSYVVNRGVRYK